MEGGVNAVALAEMGSRILNCVVFWHWSGWVLGPKCLPLPSLRAPSQPHQPPRLTGPPSTCSASAAPAQYCPSAPPVGLHRGKKCTFSTQFSQFSHFFPSHFSLQFFFRICVHLFFVFASFHFHRVDFVIFCTIFPFPMQRTMRFVWSSTVCLHQNRFFLSHSKSGGFRHKLSGRAAGGYRPCPQSSSARGRDGWPAAAWTARLRLETAHLRGLFHPGAA